jgi:prepilin-type N-terminal cleavage/methylation domain-containing protein
MRPTRESGFTMIELLIVMVILGILILTAAPSYLGFRDRAVKGTAKSNVAEATQAVHMYYQDNNTYVGMTPTLLKSYDAGINITVKSVTSTGYCIYNQNSTWVMYKNGASQAVTSTAC